MKKLSEVLEEHAKEWHDEYELGPGDVQDLFEAVWSYLTNGPVSKDLEQAILKIENVFGIG
jgi:hypothetical protein